MLKTLGGKSNRSELKKKYTFKLINWEPVQDKNNGLLRVSLSPLNDKVREVQTLKFHKVHHAYIK